MIIEYSAIGNFWQALMYVHQFWQKLEEEIRYVQIWKQLQLHEVGNI